MSDLLEGLFRESAGTLVSILTRTLGARHLDLAEECVQDALIKAMEKWPFHGVPDNPRAWLLQAAKNRAIDVLRRDRRMAAGPAEIAELQAMQTVGAGVDDELGMVFLCCHPALARESQVALILKTVGGLGVREIARAYLTPEATIAQRLVRAKNKLREAQVEFDLPQAMADCEARIDSVLEAIYLLYSEGYSMQAPEFSEEAIRLGRLLVRSPATALPRSHALLSLMLLQSARDGARMDAAGGGLVPLRDQDRALWNRERIAEGIHHISLAGHGPALSRYHLEAGIASIHALSPGWDATDWGQICKLYESLEAVHPSPVVRLNRAVAVAQHLGAPAGLGLLADAAVADDLSGYPIYYAVMGHLLEQDGRREESAQYFRRASEAARTGAEKAFFEQRAQSNIGDFLRTVTVIH